MQQRRRPRRPHRSPDPLSPSPARVRGTIAAAVAQPEDLRQLRAFHKAMADVNRLRIVRRLAHGEATVADPIALAMGRAGLTPDALTLIGFGITVVGALLLVVNLWLLGGIVVFLGGAFDMFDGTLARATNQVSKLGAFMDSVFDRWGEAIV